MRNKIIFGMVSVLVIFLIYFGDLYYKKVLALKAIKEIQHQKEVHFNRYLPKLLEDIAGSQELFALLPKTQEKDAGIILNHRLKGSDFLTLSPQTQHLLQKYGNNWPQFAADIKEKLSFEWMKKLLEYDHWEIVSNEYNAEDLFNPIHPSLLIDWSKLRLLNAHTKIQKEAAIKEVLHLATLLLSTEDVVYAMAGTSLFDAIRIFSPEAGLTSEKIESLRRVLWVSQELFSLGPAYPLGLKLGEFPTFCLSLRIGVIQSLKDKTILSSEFPNYYSALTQLLEKHKECHLKGLRALWHEQEKRKQLACSSETAKKFLGEETCHSSWLNSIPWYRSIMAQEALNASPINYWSIYDQKSTP